MQENEFKKITPLRVKRIYCPICDEWHKNGVKQDSYAEHTCYYLMNQVVFHYERDDNQMTVSQSFYCSDRRDIHATINCSDIVLDGNSVGILVSITRNAKCKEIDESDTCESCRKFFQGGGAKKVKFKLEYDYDDLIKAGIYPNEKSQEEKRMEDIMKKMGVAEKSFDIKAVANDLGINFGVNTDTRIKSTVFGTVFEYEKGRFRGFDRNSGVITDYPNIKPINLPSIILPAVSVKKGDMVFHNEEFYFITKSEEGEVYGASPKNLTELRLLPVANPIGIKCYNRLISLGELLGFKGESTQNTKIILWIATMMAQKLCEGGVDLANEKIKDFTDKSEKYVELLLPFACVAFAAYAVNGENLKGKDISKAVKKIFGIDMPELNDSKNLKRLAGVGLATGAVVTLLKGKIENTAHKEELSEGEAGDIVSKVYGLVKPYESTIKKVLPVALAICALKLFNGDKMEELRDKLEGVLLIAEDTICEKFGISEEFFNKENLKKLTIVAGVAVVVFVSYGKNIKKDGTSENNSFKKIITAVAPAIPVAVLLMPKLKEFIAKFVSKEDCSDWFDDKAEDAFDGDIVTTTQTKTDNVDVVEAECDKKDAESEEDGGTSEDKK